MSASLTPSRGASSNARTRPEASRLECRRFSRSRPRVRNSPLTSSTNDLSSGSSPSSSGGRSARPADSASASASCNGLTSATSLPKARLKESIAEERRCSARSASRARRTSASCACVSSAASIAVRSACASRAPAAREISRSTSRRRRCVRIASRRFTTMSLSPNPAPTTACMEAWSFHQSSDSIASSTPSSTRLRVSADSMAAIASLARRTSCPVMPALSAPSIADCKSTVPPFSTASVSRSRTTV
mmetsp:Transcript_75081/g.195646  ORF Transcript_75081/g.195646 Transcript_75081/m.195646 type:complete len:247 (+) Transcript_75081:1241-1981(+)